MVLGKGIKGGELFKRTDVTEEEGGQSSQIRDGEKAQGREDANPDLRKSGKAKKQKGDQKDREKPQKTDNFFATRRIWSHSSLSEAFIAYETFHSP